MSRTLLKITFATTVFAFFYCAVFAQKKNKDPDQKDEYISSDSAFVFEDHIYKKNIHTVQLHRSDWEFSSPIISLSSADKLKLSFDDLDADTKTYSYTLIHCDADWTPSNTVNSDYLSGFYDEQISDRKYSINTLQSYSHYSLIFPTENVQITKSGNYILEVFTDYDKEKYVLTKRFMVVDEKVDVNATVRQATFSDDRYFKQEVNFKINSGSYTITNPYGDLKVVLMQNDRWDNVLTGLKPAFVKDKELDYDIGDGNSFMAGSEFRHFDAKSLRFHSDHISDIYLDSTSKKYRIDLLEDEKRTIKQYSLETDINGRFKIYIQESKDNSETEADYVTVHFLLKADVGDKDGVYYVFGALTDWQYKPEFKMHFNPDRFAYECTAFLKQGYYNYEYMYLKDGDKVADVMEVEGSHWETENDYTILVYHRQMGSNYDQLISVKKKNSIKNNN